MAQWVKNLSAMQETHETSVQPLGWEDPLEEEMATHSSILAWRIRWTEEFVRLKPMESQRVGHDWVTKHSTANRQMEFYTANIHWTIAVIIRLDV